MKVAWIVISIILLGFLIDLYHKEKVKANRLCYYITHVIPIFLVPQAYYINSFKKRKQKLEKAITLSGKKYHVNYRVNYYNKIINPVKLKVLPKTAKVKKDPYINLTLHQYIEAHKYNTRSYYLDLYKGLRYFKNDKKVAIQFGDVREIQQQPTIVKSRLLCDENSNNIILKLDKARHFLFVKDKKKLDEKEGKLVWRGAVHTPLRRTLIKKLNAHPHNLINTPCIIDKGSKEERKHNFMTIRKQLDYRYILSIEGNDVATNLKWIMSSNSIAFMTKPTCESWFMEGDLVANHHYVEVKDDWSDLVEKIEYCNQNPDFCKEILNNAHRYVAQFQDDKVEELITMMVLEKYFQMQSYSK